MSYIMYNIKEDLFDVEERRPKLGEKLKHLQSLTVPLPFVSEPMSYTLEPMPVDLVERPEDDIAAIDQPSRHVDYLSHEWTEEDIWASYKFIRSKRRTITNSVRLENASWRTWEQKRRNLKTISPETVKWLKDNDVTWLYGPLQSNLDSATSSDDNYASSLSGSCSSLKKPCLKRRSLAESMLLRSISSAALLRQGSVSSSASQGSSSRSSSPHGASRSSSTPPSTVVSTRNPSPLRHQLSHTKSVRFHEKVEQRVSLSHFEDDELECPTVTETAEDIARRRKATDNATAAWLSSTEERRCSSPSRTIEKLPYVTLKSPVCEDDSESDGGSSDDGTPATPVTTLLGDDDETWRPKWTLSARGNIQLFDEDLEAMKSHTENTSTSDLACNPFFFGSKTPDVVRDTFSPFQSLSRNALQKQNNAHWTSGLEFPSHDSEDNAPFDSESSSDNTDEQDQLNSIPVMDSSKTALVNRIMEQFWVVFNTKDYTPVPATLSAPDRGRQFTHETGDVLTARALANHEQSLRQSLPIFVRKRVEGLVQEQRDPDESSILAGLTTIITDCQEKVLHAYQSSDLDDMDYHLPISRFNDTLSPVTTSDSGYGSEPVRDIFREETEKSKAVRDWDAHSTEWDDDEEAAWESSF